MVAKSKNESERRHIDRGNGAEDEATLWSKYVSHSIYDLQPSCQSKHDSQVLAEAVTPYVRLACQAMDPWSGGQLIGINSKVDGLN